MEPPCRPGTFLFTLHQLHDRREALGVFLLRIGQGQLQQVGGKIDADAVADYAEDAMRWAAGNGIIAGLDDTLSPTAPATRVQAAAIMMRFGSNVK